MNKMNWKWTLVCAAALVALTVLLDAVAWAGKPGGGGGTTLVNPTPIKYQIQFWDVPTGGTPSIRGTNNLGQTVGEFDLPDGDPNTPDTLHAYLYDPAAFASTVRNLHRRQLPSRWHKAQGRCYGVVIAARMLSSAVPRGARDLFPRGDVKEPQHGRNRPSGQGGGREPGCDLSLRARDCAWLHYLRR